MAKKIISQGKGIRQDVKSRILAYKPPVILPIWAISLFFIATTLIFFWDQIFGNYYFWEDFVEYVFPAQSFAAREFAKGILPFWNPYTFSGMPFLADLQVGFFYPLNRMLSLFLGTGHNLPVAALEFVIIIHFFIAQINMYFLSRYFKISSFGSLIAAVSFSFSMLLVCHVIHPMIIYHLAWLPLVVLYVYKGLTTLKIKYGIIAGLILGFSILSGHPQMTLYEGFFIGVLILWQGIAKIKNKEIQKNINYIRLAAIALLPFVIAIGIFAIQYMPSKELASLSQRNESSYSLATEGSIQVKQLYSTVVPKIFGYVDGSDSGNIFYLKFRGEVLKHHYWESAFYFGIVAMFLGIFGAIMFYKNRIGAMLLFFIIFGTLFSLGENSFLFGIFYNLPLFGTFRNPGRMMFAVILSLSLLSGFGFDILWQQLKEKKILISIIIISIIPLLIALLTAAGTLPESLGAPEEYISQVKEYGTISFVLLTAVISISILMNRRILRPEISGSILVVAAFIDLFIAGASFNKSTQNPEAMFELKPELKSLLSIKPPKDLFRVNMRLYKPVRFMAMERNQGLVDNIMLIEGYNPLILDRVAPPVPDTKTAFDLYNVRYAVKIDQQTGGWNFEKRDSSFPHAWIVHKVHIFQPEETSSKMKNGNYNYLAEAVVEEDPGITLADSAIMNPADVTHCIRYENNYMEYLVKNSQPGLMVFSEIYYPAWKAYVDGQPAKILRTNYCFRSIPIPAGEHKVEMKYKSASFNTGMIATIITLFASVTGLVMTRIFGGKEKESE